MKKKVFLMIIALAGFFSGCNQTEKKLPERVSLVHSKYDMGGMMLGKGGFIIYNNGCLFGLDFGNDKLFF